MYRLLQVSLQKASRAQRCRSGPSLRENLLIASVVNRAKAGILSGQTLVVTIDSHLPRQSEPEPADYDLNSDDEGGDESCREEVQPSMDVVYASEIHDPVSHQGHVHIGRRRTSSDTWQGDNCRKRPRLVCDEPTAATAYEEVGLSADRVASHKDTPKHSCEEAEQCRGSTTKKDSNSFLDWSRASKRPRFDSKPFYYGGWEQRVAHASLWQSAMVF